MVLHRRSQVPCVIIVRCGCGEGVQVYHVALDGGWKQWKSLSLIFQWPSSVFHRQFEMESCFERQKKVSVFRPVSRSHNFGPRCYFFLKRYSICWGSLLGIVWTSHSGKVFSLLLWLLRFVSRFMTSLLLTSFICWVSVRPVFYILTSFLVFNCTTAADCFLCCKSLDPLRCL